MKQKSLILVLLLISICSFGRKFYTLSKEEFASQFTVGMPLDRIYCYNEAGDKVWLYVNQASILTLVIGEKETNLVLQKTSFSNGNINGPKQSSLAKIGIFNIDDVQGVRIYTFSREQELPYFDADLRKKEVGQHNDSLRNEFLKQSDHSILLVSKNYPEDTIRIVRDACYDLKFSNGDETHYGVILRITADSIRVSSCFNSENAVKSGLSYKIYDHAISDISNLSLAKSGGYGYKSVPVTDYNVFVIQVSRENLYPACWYAMDKRSGVIKFYRSWLTERRFKGIAEEKGDIFWYEGGITR